jgi:hypothetical protein
MNLILRAVLIAGALLTLIYFVYQIRKKRLQIDYTLFWVLFSGLLFVVALFPQIIISAAHLLGVDSPANLVFLVIIFLLVLRLFSVTLKLSRLNQQVSDLIQRLALVEKKAGDDTE